MIQQLTCGCICCVTDFWGDVNKWEWTTDQSKDTMSILVSQLFLLGLLLRMWMRGYKKQLYHQIPSYIAAYKIKKSGAQYTAAGGTNWRVLSRQLRYSDPLPKQPGCSLSLPSSMAGLPLPGSSTSLCLLSDLSGLRVSQ